MSFAEGLPELPSTGLNPGWGSTLFGIGRFGRFYRPPASGEATARERGWGDGQAAVGRRSVWMNVSVHSSTELGSVGARLSAAPLFSSASAPVRHFSIWRITRSIKEKGGKKKGRSFDPGVVVARRRRRGRQKKIAARPSVGRLVKRPHLNMGHGNGWDR